MPAASSTAAALLNQAYIDAASTFNSSQELIVGVLGILLALFAAGAILRAIVASVRLSRTR